MRMAAVICVLRAAAALTLLSAWPCAAQQPRRVAIVVGNSDYDGDGQLDPVQSRAAPKNFTYASDLTAPKRDLERVAKILAARGFEVHQAADQDAAGVETQIEKFNALAQQAKANDELIFYFSGHSVQIEETLYLIPVGAALIDDPRQGESGPTYAYREKVTKPLVGLTRFKLPARQAGATGYNLILLDSCRDNPWPDLAGRGIPLAAGQYMLAAGSGLPARPRGTILALAAAPGSQAQGDPDSSPFTDALLTKLDKPGHLMTILFDAGQMVSDATGAEQLPHFYFDALPWPCFERCPPETTGTFLDADGAGLPDEALRAAKEAVASAVSAEAFAGSLNGSKPLTFDLHYYGMTVEGMPAKPPPAVVRQSSGVAVYSEYEVQDLRYAGQFVDGVPHGKGVLQFECAVVFLRARCPLSLYHRYRGTFRKGLPTGPGDLVGLVSGRHDYGIFSSERAEDSPVAEAPPALTVGISTFPDGRMEVGRFEKGLLRSGIRLGRYRRGTERLGTDCCAPTEESQKKGSGS